MQNGRDYPCFQHSMESWGRCELLCGAPTGNEFGYVSMHTGAVYLNDLAMHVLHIVFFIIIIIIIIIISSFLL